MSRADHQKFIKLLMPLSKQIQAYVYHLAWNTNDVEDIFQSALLSAYRKFDTFIEGTNFKAWMFKFVTYEAFNFNRKHSRISSHEVLMEADDILTSTEALEADVRAFDYGEDFEEFLKSPDKIVPEFSLEIQHVLKKLPEKRRSIFLLRAVGELSYKEIAQLCQIPQGSVMGELFRARKTLREMLLKKIKKSDSLTQKDGSSDAM